MLILLRVMLFSCIMAGLWMYQPPILKQQDPVVVQHENINHKKSEQSIEGAFYRMNDKGLVWDIFASTAIAQKEGVRFHQPRAQASDGRFFIASEGYWSFAEQKIYFVGGLEVVDPSKNFELHGTSACYDIAKKELFFDESVQGQYAADF